MTTEEQRHTSEGPMRPSLPNSYDLRPVGVDSLMLTEREVPRLIVRTRKNCGVRAYICLVYVANEMKLIRDAARAESRALRARDYPLADELRRERMRASERRDRATALALGKLPAPRRRHHG